MKEQAAPGSPPDINARIAARVRFLRSESGLTLDGLAAKSTVSRSMISLVERGESSPTAVVLEKIATGLGVALATLFDDSSTTASPVSHRADRRPWRDPQSGYVRCNISPPDVSSPIRIVEVMLPAGAHVAYDSGPREVNIHQQIWVQEGVVEVTVDQAVHRLDEGDCLAMQLNVPTAFQNRSRKAARYIVVVSSDRPHPSRK